MARQLTALDFFAGAGGISLGLEQAGFRVLAANELEPQHLLVHAKNLPGAKPLLGSIEDWTAERIFDLLGIGPGDLDVVAGGPPCQGFSVIGRRDLTDPRNNLALTFAQRVLELRPRAFVMENVPGMRAGPFREVLDAVVEYLAPYYDIPEVEVLNAADYGVPQNRKRLFVIGIDRSLGVTPRYPAKTHSTDPALGRLPTPTVRDAIWDLPTRMMTVNGGSQLPHRFEATSEYAREMRSPRFDALDRAHPRLGWDSSVLDNCDITAHTPAVVERFRATKPGKQEAVSRFYRLKLDGVSYTLRAGTGPERGSHTAARPIHPSSARVITVREAARLHSFPDWYSFHETIWHGFREVGNSVPPRMMRAVANAVRDCLAVADHKSVAEQAAADATAIPAMV